MSTLGINDRVVRTVIHKINWKSDDKKVVSLDNRGKHLNYNKVSDEIKKSIRNHISSTPRIDSHYICAESQVEYIEGGKSVSQLHRNYQELQIKKIILMAITSCIIIFLIEFNISAFRPKKEQCAFCASYQNADTVEKEKMANEYNIHIE